MDYIYFFEWLNGNVLATPATILFLSSGLFVSLYLNLPQVRLVRRFTHIILRGFAHRQHYDKYGNPSTISPFHALFTAMGTAIGTGSIVAPSVAIMTGGPGALFWLVFYLILGAAIRFVEVSLALHTRKKLPDGCIIGGPMQYLSTIHPFWSQSYGIAMLVLFCGWQMVQANNLANIFATEGIQYWVTGLVLALLGLIVLAGGAVRVGLVASRLVPLMFFCYVTFALFIIWQQRDRLAQVLLTIFSQAFSLSPLCSGVAGIGMLSAMKAGIYRGIFISEAGLGTASIPQAIADTKQPTDQGTLALYSIIADIALSTLSGLLVLVSGVWQHGALRSTMIYEIFKTHVPGFGQGILLLSISLFVFTTIIGNGFNGLQLFATFTRDRFRVFYIIATGLTVFIGALVPMPFAWAVMDTILACAVIPHLIGLLILMMKHKTMLLS
jgi:alanine or glycine:cation symporter, AGCS family